MSTDNFLKKIFFRIACVALGVFCTLSCIYAGVITDAKRVDVNCSFYFLVTNDVKTEVGAEFAKLEGGAGYLLEHDGVEYVTLAVYLEENEGLTVQENLQREGRTTSLLQKGVLALWFKGAKKRHAYLYVNGLNIFKSYIYLLNETIKSLDEGLTQERCKSLLKTQLKQYQYAKECYWEYSALSEVFDKSAQQLFAILEEVVYLKDLRYLLCWQTEKYIELCEEFSI